MMSAKNYLKAWKRIKPSLYTCLVNSLEIVTSGCYLFIFPSKEMVVIQHVQTKRFTDNETQKNILPKFLPFQLYDRINEQCQHADSLGKLIGSSTLQQRPKERQLGEAENTMRIK